ncbi:MAG: hypothetical protein JJE04_01665 [Acidobacteriia bacterium]|nr:hypothetical protein [Terriglobia bacterium]
MGLLSLLLAAAATHAVVSDVALRSGCDPEDTPLATVSRGDAVEIRFALAGGSGACYNVSVDSGGKTLQGYLNSKAITGIDEFERGRASAAGFDSPQAVRQDMAVVRKPATLAHANEKVMQAARLLENNQPAESLQLLESVVRANHRDGAVLALAGLAAYQSDQVKLAIDYWQDSITLAPEPSVERLLRKAQREAAGDSSTEKLFGAYFQFRYDPREVSADEARSLVPVLDNEFARLSEELGCRSAERMTAVVQSRQAYQQSTGASEWSGGLYDGRIRVALLEPRPGPLTRRSLAHEIVHACLARLGNWPVWFHEGLAQKLSGDSITGEQMAAVRTLARSGKLPALEQLTGSYSRMGSDHAAIAYMVSLASADLLYQSYGKEGVRSLLQSPERLPRISQELDRRLHE